MLDAVGDALGMIVSLGALITVVWKFKLIAVLGQMGSVQERNAPWSRFTKPHLDQSGSPQLTKEIASADLTKKIERSLLQWDKLVYTGGVLNFGASAYLIGAAPQYYYLWHTVKACVYISHRWWTFKQQGQHYYLFDFCYWANFLSLVYLWVLPQSTTLFQILFLVANGPLAWSVCAFSNSLIFHSAPHMTSVFIHTSPMILTYGLRWYPQDKFAVCENWPKCVPDADAASWMPDLGSASLRVWQACAYFYVWWAVLYYLWIYVIRARRIEERGYETLFDYVIKDTPVKVLARLTSNLTIQRIIYLCIHLTFGSLVMLLASVFHYNSWAAHLTFCNAIIGASAWNASGYYFTVFVRRYETQLSSRAEKKLK